MYKNLILPAGLLSSTIIGAGIFALPYLIGLSGALTGLFYLIFFAGALTLVHLMYADIVLRTPENHRFPGYARFYFGRSGFWLAFVLGIFGGIFALTIYLVLSVSFVNLIGVVALADVYKLLIFWFLGSLALFLEIKKLVFSELLILAGVALIILMIFIFSLGDFEKVFSLPLFDFRYLFLPYGAILFSLGGRVAISPLLGYFRNRGLEQIKAKNSIILGSLAPAVVYLFFILGVLGLSDAVSQDSVSGLINVLPLWFLKALGVFGLVSLWSTYIVIGREIKKTFEHDLNLGPLIAGFSVGALPLLLYFLGFKNFLDLVSFAGGLFLSIEGILIILMWRRASKIKIEKVFLENLNPLIIYFLLLVFGGGIVYTLLY